MTVSIVGLGFVGLTTALGFAEYGHKVYGIEADPKKLAVIQSGKLPFIEPDLDDVLRRHLDKNFMPTSDWQEAVHNSSIVYFCVGTPYGPDGQADLTMLFRAIQRVLDMVSDDQFRTLVIKSTVPPGTTARRIIPFVKEGGSLFPAKLGIATNPEFLREGHCWEDFIHADRIVLGVQDRRVEIALRELYQDAGIPIYAVSFNTSEFIKYLSNTVLACLISYANEMSLAADAIGDIDVTQAFRILHMDHRWQSGTIRSYFYPGCGYGGYCLPKDTNAFYAVTKHCGFEGNILREVIKLNDAMPQMAAKRIIRVAEQETKTCIGILGLSFNPGSDDVRETSSAKIIRELNHAGFENVLVYDPVAMNAFQAQYDLIYQCVESYRDILMRADIFAITTAWEEFRTLPSCTEKPIVDCRYMFA